MQKKFQCGIIKNVHDNNNIKQMYQQNNIKQI
jgi:hypothetical protein